MSTHDIPDLWGKRPSKDSGAGPMWSTSKSTGTGRRLWRLAISIIPLILRAEKRISLLGGKARACSKRSNPLRTEKQAIVLASAPQKPSISRKILSRSPGNRHQNTPRAKSAEEISNRIRAYMVMTPTIFVAYRMLLWTNYASAVDHDSTVYNVCIQSSKKQSIGLTGVP